MARKARTLRKGPIAEWTFAHGKNQNPNLLPIQSPRAVAKDDQQNTAEFEHPKATTVKMIISMRNKLTIKPDLAPSAWPHRPTSSFLRSRKNPHHIQVKSWDNQNNQDKYFDENTDKIDKFNNAPDYLKPLFPVEEL